MRPMGAPAPDKPILQEDAATCDVPDASADDFLSIRP